MIDNANYTQKEIPKVLIVDHPPISKEGIGKTLYAFFAKWPREKLAQIYTVNLPLDTSLCEYYFYDIEGKGRDIAGTDVSDIICSDRKKSHNCWKSAKEVLKIFAHSNLGTICRNLYYGRKIVNHKKLKEWIRAFSPEFIFFGVGEIVSENIYILEMASNLKIPLILYVSDDYLGKWEKEPFFKKYVRDLKNNYNALMEYASMVVVISDKMKEVYQKRYSDQHYYIAQNSAYIKDYLIDTSHFINEKKLITISYTGNIGLKRWKVLKRIKKAIAEINKSNIKYIVNLKIYTPTIISSFLKGQIVNEYAKYEGSVEGNKLDKARFDSDVLLFVESFEKKFKPILSTALSTKIPEYLSYHRNILAIAPEYSWSAKYLQEKNAASCIFETDNLAEKLKIYFDDLYSGNLADQVYSGYQLFLQKHEFKKNAEDFLNEFLKVKRVQNERMRMI